MWKRGTNEEKEKTEKKEERVDSEQLIPQAAI